MLTIDILGGTERHAEVAETFHVLAMHRIERHRPRFTAKINFGTHLEPTNGGTGRDDLGDLLGLVSLLRDRPPPLQN